MSPPSRIQCKPHELFYARLIMRLVRFALSLVLVLPVPAFSATLPRVSSKPPLRGWTPRPRCGSRPTVASSLWAGRPG